MTAPIDGFVDGLTGLGLDPRVESELVIYTLEPVEGARAGQPVETGVALSELARWPQVPPHWIHLPDSIEFARTNRQPSPRSGWSMHSRNLHGWGAGPLAAAWVAHVRAVLGEAIA